MGLRQAAVATLVALVLASGCGGQRDRAAIRIGVALPLTGSAAAFGEQMRMGADLAMAGRNARGGIDGRRIELVYGDDRGRASQASVVAKRFADDRGIVAVIGHYNSSCSLAGKPIYREAGVVQFSPGSTNVDVCRGSDWTFRNLYSDDYLGRAIARYVSRTLGLTRAAVLYDSDAYGAGLKDAFSAEATRVGLDVVAAHPYEREATLDFSAALDDANARGAEVIFISGLYNEAALIARAARDAGIHTPFIGGDGVLSEALLDLGGTAVEGMLMTTPFIVHRDVGGPAARDFREAFFEAYDRTADTWAALSYDALNQLFEAIEEEAPDRTRIRDYLAGMTSPERGYSGVTGATYFDENGDCFKQAYVAVVRNGEFVPSARQLSTP